MRLIDGHIGVCVRTGVGVGDGDASEAFAANDPRLLARLPLGIEQCIGCVSVAMSPAIDGDALDVARGIEARAAEHAAQLVADVALEFLERSAHQLNPSGTILIA